MIRVESEACVSILKNCSFNTTRLLLLIGSMLLKLIIEALTWRVLCKSKGASFSLEFKVRDYPWFKIEDMPHSPMS